MKIVYNQVHIAQRIGISINLRDQFQKWGWVLYSQKGVYYSYPPYIDRGRGEPLVALYITVKELIGA